MLNSECGMLNDRGKRRSNGEAIAKQWRSNRSYGGCVSRSGIKRNRWPISCGGADGHNREDHKKDTIEINAIFIVSFAVNHVLALNTAKL